SPRVDLRAGDRAAARPRRPVPDDAGSEWRGLRWARRMARRPPLPHRLQPPEPHQSLHVRRAFHRRPGGPDLRIRADRTGPDPADRHGPVKAMLSADPVRERHTWDDTTRP